MDDDMQMLIEEIWALERPKLDGSVFQSRGQGFIETMLSENSEKQDFHLWTEIEVFGAL